MSVSERNNPFQQPSQRRIEAERARRGTTALAEGCAKLILGDYTDTKLIMVLGGPSARWPLDTGKEELHYWYRVWGARGLLWSWDDCALPTIITATHDEAWRVREMAAKVVARHLLGDALPAVAPLRDDPIPRVRAAATRAITRLTQAGA